ncbi:hypothetical protein LTR65_008662 [Meristemomyces frigidus]
MAPMASSSAKGGKDMLSLQEIVFSCGMCQATPSEVYATRESNHGFHSGSADEDGTVTKLWIAECSHITCGKHLEGGAAPFHPKDMQPLAPCPHCMEKGDHSFKELYSIRGLAEGEYDARIPTSWTDCPPIKLDGSVPGMEAMRFQYMNLARYAQCIDKQLRKTEHKWQTMEAAYSKERKHRRQTQAEVLELRARVEDLGKGEAQLKKWELRKPLINHYLGAVGEMARDIETMRSQLSRLGYHVPERSYTFEPDKALKPKETAPDQRDLDQHYGESFSSSSTAVAAKHDNSSSSRKRKLAEYTADVAQSTVRERPPRRSSRDLMPPPLPRLQAPRYRVPPSVEPIASQPFRRPPSSRQSVRVFEDRSWRPQQSDSHGSQHTSTYAPSRPQSTANRGRISFQPGQQPTSLARSQEQALSQIRGVRGLSSQGVQKRTYESGIGAATCENLASKGCSLIINYTSDSSAEKTQKFAEQLQTNYGVRCLPVQADMGSENGPAHIVNTALNYFARPKTRKLQIDVVINNAGVASKTPLEDSECQEFARLYNVNVRGPLLLMKAVMPYLPYDRSGRVVNVSSVSSSLGFHEDGMYGGTKAALEAMTRTYAGTSQEFQQKMSHWTRNTPLAAIRPDVDRQDLAGM